MIVALRVFFLVVFASMLAVTVYASNHVALWELPREIGTHPWMIACLFDAYWGFLTFYCWVLYRSATWLARGAWLVAILLLGNFAMAAYMLGILFKLPTTASAKDVLLRPAHT